MTDPGRAVFLSYASQDAEAAQELCNGPRAAGATALNPVDGNSIAFLGELLTYLGDRERGLALAGARNSHVIRS